jgi:tRNA(adenine34) deaminase
MTSAREETTPRPAAAGADEPVHRAFMRQALEGARSAMHIGEVPIGAVVVFRGEAVADGFNQPRGTQDPTAHAEIIALRRAARALGNYRLPGTTLYVTLEPCLMCVGAIVNARVTKVVYGADEPKFGAIRSVLEVAKLALNHRFEVVPGVLEDECRKLVVDFFQFQRKLR